MSPRDDEYYQPGPDNQGETEGSEKAKRDFDERGGRHGGRHHGPGRHAHGPHNPFGEHGPGPRGPFGEHGPGQRGRFEGGPGGRGPWAWGEFPGRNFWREWFDERGMGHPGGMPFGQPLSVQEMHAWREFFHQQFGVWPQDHWIFGARRFSPWHQGLDSFNPFVATLLSKGGGLLPLYVLHLVAEQPRYGNEIMDMLAERTNGQWVSNPGAIYPLLNQMESEEFIEGKWADPAKRTVRVYSITAKGQEELARIKTIVGPKLEETVQVLGELIEDLRGQDTSATGPETTSTDKPGQP